MKESYERDDLYIAEGLEKQRELALGLTRGKEYISTRSHIHAY